MKINKQELERLIDLIKTSQPCSTKGIANYFKLDENKVQVFLNRYKKLGIIRERGVGDSWVQAEKFEEYKHRLILENPNLFNEITEKELDKKIVGEINTRKTIFLCFCGSLVENNNIASYNLMVNSESGAGKDYIVNRILEILPKEMWIKRTRISEKVLTYWHDSKSDPGWTWNGKILYIEDVNNRVLNSDVMKVFCSSGSFATVLINQKAVDILIRGKPVMVITTASPNPSNELLRRYAILNLDESINQTKEIIKRQAKLIEKRMSIEYDKSITKALSFLKRVKVRIPYASNLVKIFPPDHIIMRTHFSRFLDYIKASTAFHQYQRKQDEEGYYLAAGQDYDIARIALLKTTSNPLMIPLTKTQRRIIEVFERLNKMPYSIPDLVQYINFIGERWLRKQLDRLCEFGFFKKATEHREGGFKPMVVYEYCGSITFDIPKWEKLVQIPPSKNEDLGVNELFEVFEQGIQVKDIEEKPKELPAKTSGWVIEKEEIKIED